MSAITGRLVPCATCNAQIFNHCVDANGNEIANSHPGRLAAAAASPFAHMNPSRFEMLRKLHLDPTTRIQPSMRSALIRLELILPAQPTGPTPGHMRRRKGPVSYHPLTAAGRAAIGVEK